MGTILGGIAGGQRDSGVDVGSNLFGGGSSYGLGQGQLQSNVGNAIDLGKQNTLGNSTQQVQSNGILSGLFGQGGAMNTAENQYQNLANRGFSLQPEDYEAYGQGAGNIARQFGQNDQSLSQALSDRGLDSSGVANQAFSGSLGNKNEQLSQLQMQIAQQRMQMNQQRLNQTQNFLGQMGAQAQGAIGKANDIQNRQSNQEFDQSTGYMKDIQGVNQKAFDDRQDTMQPSQFAKTAAGVQSGMNQDVSMMGKMGMSMFGG